VARPLPVALTLGAAGLALVGTAPRPLDPAGDVGAAAAAAGPGRLVVDLVDGARLSDVERVEAAVGADLDWVDPRSEDEALVWGDVPDVAAAVAALAGVAGVEAAEGDVVLSAFGYPDDPLYPKQWHLDAMGAPRGWASTPRGAGVVVAVIDTGVAVVEDLDAARILDGASFVPGVTSWADDNGHGTHVAGTIAQATNNGVGVAGVAPEAQILPVKVLSADGVGSSAQIAAGIDWAVDQGADVINLSLGGSYSAAIHVAVKKARDRGVLVVAAAGNTGREGVSWPGALSEAIGVSAVGPDGTLAPYSSWGQGVDLAAPGGDKTRPGGGVLQDTIVRGGGHAYTELQGTSMAAPHVAGAAAVLLSTGECDVACVEQALLRGSDGTSWDPKVGYGALNLSRSLSVVGDGWRMVRFGVAGLLAVFVASLAESRRSFAGIAAVVAAVTAGGLFFLDAIPGVGHGVVVRLLSTGVLAWPGVLVDPWYAALPPWCSALAPGLVALLFGGSRFLRAPALGLCVGYGVALVHGAALGTIAPVGLGSWGFAWLVANATVCAALALSLAGVEKLAKEGK
jgi:serine protease